MKKQERGEMEHGGLGRDHLRRVRHGTTPVSDREGIGQAALVRANDKPSKRSRRIGAIREHNKRGENEDLAPRREVDNSEAGERQRAVSGQ